MSSPRIAPLDPPYTDDLRQSFDVVMPPGAAPLNILRTVGRNPRVLSRMVRGGLLDKGSVSIADRELVILRACARCGASYEWGVHAAIFGDAAGLGAEQLDDTWSDIVEASLWSEAQKALLEMVDQLHRHAQLDDGAWAALSEHFDEQQVIELIMLAGLYHAVSFMVNALRIEAEPFATPAPGQSFPRQCPSAVR